MLKKNTTKKRNSSPGLKRKIFFNSLLITGATLPLLVLNLFFLHQNLPYNSDDVIQQLLVADWQQHQHVNALVGQDTFILKIPLYAIINNAVASSPLTLYATIVILLSGMEFLLAIFLQLIGLEFGMSLLLCLYTASFGGYTLLWLRTPNIRNIELSAALLLSYCGYKISRTDRRSFGFALAFMAIVFATGLLLLDDPYVLYVIFAPSVIATLIVVPKKKPAMIINLLFLTGSVLIWKVFQHISYFLGLRTLSSPITPPSTLHNLVVSVWHCFDGAAWILMDKQIGVTLKYIAPLYLLIFIFMAYLALWPILAKQTQESGAQYYWCSILGILIFLFTLGAYVASGEVDGSANHRYLIGLLPGLLCMIAGSDIYTKKSQALTVVLSCLLLINVGQNLHWYFETKRVNNTSYSKVISDYVKKTGLKVGYADYWDANINTYFSNNSFKLLPMLCGPAGFSDYRWAVNEPNFPNTNTNSFFIYINTNFNNPLADKPKYRSSNCTVADIALFFPGRIQSIDVIDQTHSIVTIKKP